MYSASRGVVMLRTYMLIPSLFEYYSDWPLWGSHHRETKQQEEGGNESDR